MMGKTQYIEQPYIFKFLNFILFLPANMNKTF